MLRDSTNIHIPNIRRSQLMSPSGRNVTGNAAQHQITLGLGKLRRSTKAVNRGEGVKQVSDVYEHCMEMFGSYST